jgi:hypothetical protein
MSAIWLLPASKYRRRAGCNSVGVHAGPRDRTRAREVYRAMRNAGIDPWDARHYIVVLLATRADVVYMDDLT